MKLVAAKCPQCGARIKLDKDSDRTKCEFCKNTIMVQDAIAKVKVEHSGSVKIEGVKTNKDFITQGKKYLKINNYEKAIDSFEKALDSDNFNLEAGALLIQARAEYADIKLSENGFDHIDIKNIFLYNEYFCENQIRELVKIIKEFDDNNEFVSALNIANEKLKFLDEIKVQRKEYEDNLKDYRRQISVLFLDNAKLFQNMVYFENDISNVKNIADLVGLHKPFGIPKTPSKFVEFNEYKIVFESEEGKWGFETLSPLNFDETIELLKQRKDKVDKKVALELKVLKYLLILLMILILLNFLF